MNEQPQPADQWRPEIAAAFVKAQAELPDITKGRKAKVEMKGGGSYSYTYADLGDVLNAVRPVLARHGLAIGQDVRTFQRGLDVFTTLVHSSGESVTFGPLTFDAGGTPQQAGSAITYARRYSLLAALGLATEDDDGGAAAARKPTPAAPPPAEDDPDKPTPAMTKRAMALFAEHNLNDRDDRLSFVRSVTGRDVQSWNDVTRAEASQVIDALTESGKS